MERIHNNKIMVELHSEQKLNEVKSKIAEQDMQLQQFKQQSNNENVLRIEEQKLKT